MFFGFFTDKLKKRRQKPLIKFGTKNEQRITYAQILSYLELN
jgi:hypothetical protein